jgi:AmmeMemoRadiSam system protein B
MIRPPAVAGQFYKIKPDALTHQIEALVQPNARRTPARAVICPHAGLMYSGSVAGAVYSGVALPETFILVGPNHTGLGSAVSVFAEGSWLMPHGPVPIASEMASLLLEHSSTAEPDLEAHRFEHSIEVQLPFLQHFLKRLSIVPIVMQSADLDVCRDIGGAIAHAVRDWNRPVLLIASTDMTHYEPDRKAREKDSWALDQILSLDAEGLHRVVRENHISMCGFGPTVAVLFAALDLDVQQASLIKYRTSGEVNGDYERVVGYAGLVLK